MYSSLYTYLVQPYRAHRHLHSFPTRRSSDLESKHCNKYNQCYIRLCFYFWVLANSRNGHCRSEEHTSELQSRGHLVCRLLLEKKKVTETMKGSLKANSVFVHKSNHDLII